MISASRELQHAMGEPVEFQNLYRDEFDRQVRRAALIVGSSEAANDLVQDTFISLYQRWDTIKDPGPYLHRSVMNACREQGRRQVRDQKLLRVLSDPPEDIESPEILWDVLATLPFNHRAALVLRYYGQLTEREIADQLGCRQGSVGPWIQRGLNSMRKAL